MTELLLNLNEVAKRLSVSRRTVENLIAKNALASVKIGRSRRVAAGDLQHYIDLNTEPIWTPGGET